MHPQMTSVATSQPTVDAGKDLFALSDDQILDIGPEADAPSDAGQATDAGSSGRQASTSSQTEKTAGRSLTSAPNISDTSHESPATSHDSAEPPAWLAAQMQDPWGGEEAREFWDGVQQARTEAAAYRAAFATPEDARALKELYPGGVAEARAAAERGRLLEEIDRAYFGAAGNSPQQLSASRAQLAQRMLREDPAAFREMVEAGVRALQAAGNPQDQRPKSIASAVSDARNNTNAGLSAGTSSVLAQHAAPVPGNQPTAVGAPPAYNDPYLAAYAAFERVANEDLERSVGGAIDRTLAQALPSFEQHNTPGQTRLGEHVGVHRTAPLRERLAASVRVDVEKALQGDRQLGEQVAQILSSRRFDNDARAHVVRLIGERAQQLVPGAAKRVLNDWTQTTLAAHRGRTQRAEAASAKEVAPASVTARPVAGEQRSTHTLRDSRHAGATRSQQVNYRKLSDEQILDL